MSCTSVVVWKQALFLAPCEHRALLPLILSLAYGRFLTCIHWWVLRLRITDCDLQVFSLSSELRLLWSPWSLTFVSSPGSHPGSASVSPPLLPGNSAKAINRARVRAHRVCFLPLRGYCSSLPHVPVAWCFRYSIKFWFGAGVNLPDFFFHSALRPWDPVGSIYVMLVSLVLCFGPVVVILMVMDIQVVSCIGSCE